MIKLKYAVSFISCALSLTALCSASADNLTSSSTDINHYFYLGTNVGGDLPVEAQARSVDFGTGMSLGIYTGYRFNKNFRIDVSYDYLRNMLKNHNAAVDEYEKNGSFGMMHSQTYILVNTYYNMSLVNDKLQPYIGFGLGEGIKKVEADDESSEKTPHGSMKMFGWQAAIGVNYRVLPYMGVGLSYRLLSTVGEGGIESFNHFNKNSIYNNILNASLYFIW